MKKRILSLLLVVLMFVSAIPVASTYASENADELSLWLVDDSDMEQPAENVALYRGGAVRLAAHRGAAVSGGLQWQIASGDEWINIQGATAETLRVSYGMVASLLVDDTARLRCTVGEYESEAVTIRVTEEDPAPAAPAEPLSAPEPLPAPEATVVESAPEPTPETDPVPESEPTPETDPAPESEPTPEPTGEEGIATMALDGDNGPALTVPSAKTYTVTIYYVYSEESQFKDRNVAQPYVAQYAEGETVTLNVSSPNCIGYTPSETTFNKTIENLTNDQVYYVYYSPAQVSYSVRHYLQNVDDDEYTLDTTTVVSGYTEAMTEDTAARKDYVGFTALSHVNEQIAADGSTIVDIYYDREYYMFTFDLDGGYGVEPVYARYGAPISVGPPTKAGYSFSHWVDVNENRVEIPATMPESGGAYKAVWTPNDGVKITVVYWLQDADEDTTYHYWTAATQTAQPGSTKNATEYRDYTQWLDATALGAMDTYEKRYSTYNEDKTAETGGVTVAGDGSTILNVYYDRKAYTLKFYYAAYDTSNDVYKVYGGSTYVFGYHYTQGTDNSDEKDILNAVYTGDRSSQWGKVGNTAPELNTEGKARQESGDYTLGRDTDVTANTEFLYLSFTARYGEDISELWPCNVFEPAERSDKSEDPKNGWSGTAAFVSAWNGEHHVYYSKKNSNETIKGNYMKLDYQLLWDYETFGDSEKVAYLCFWENGCDANFEWNVPKLFRYNLWVPVVDNTKPDDATTTTNNGVEYYLLKTYDTCDNDENVNSQTPPAISGYTNSARKITDLTLDETAATQYQKGFTVDFFYTRNEYDLTFINGDRKIDESRKMPYGKKVWSYYQENIENKLTYYEEARADIYEFEGWYSDPNFLEKYDLNEDTTMPPNNGTLYAHWVPKSYTVTVLADKGAETALDTQRVAYSGNATEPTLGDREDTSFIGWFYEDVDGVEYAFSFEGTRIVGDMTVYAKWRSTQTCPITVKYVLVGENGQPLLDEDGNEILVAKTETQKLPVGQLRTYNAKTGTALYPACREGYFPTVASQSITPTEDMVENGSTVVFKYRQYEAVPYKVRFVIADENGDETPAFMQKDGEIVFAPTLAATATGYEEYIEEHNDNKMSIVTELYVPEAMLTGTWTLPEGYVPDAIQKQLIVVPGENGPENEANTIKFVYRLESGQARYSVNQYVQNADGSGYTQYKHEDFLAAIGSTVSASPITIAGYEFSVIVTDEKKAADVTRSTENALSGTVAKDHSLELNFYYDAIEYPYQIMYLEQGSNQVLKAPKTTDDSGNELKARYGTTVTATADAIDNYTPVKESESIVIQQEAKNEAGAYVVSQNIIYLYYKPVSGGLRLSKTVKLDPTQAQEEGIKELPDAVMAQKFKFTITAADGFHKSVYSYTRTNGDTSTTETAIVDGRSLTVTLKAGDTVTFDSLHVGAYTVTETYVPGFRSVVGNTIQQSVDVTVTKDNTTQVAFENQYPFYTGTLVVQKAVITQQGDPAPVGSYKVHVKLFPNKEAREVDRTVKWTDASNTQQSLKIPKWKDDETDETEFSLDILVPAGTAAEPGHVELEGVPVGTFQVEELPRAATGNITDYYTVHYDYALHQNDEKNNEPGSLVTGNIHGGHPTAVTFRNTPKTGGLNIEKTVTQEYADDSFQSDTFAFIVTGYSELPAGTYSVSNGAYTATVDENGNVTLDKAVTVTVAKAENQTEWTASAALAGLPAGKYTVTETEKEGYTCQQENAQVTGLQVGGENAPTAAFTNTFKRTTGNLTVSKKIELTKSDEGITIDSTKDFEFTLLLTNGTLTDSYSYIKGTDNGSLTVVDGKLTFTLKHGENITINGLPVGKYRVLETKVAGYGSSFDAMADDSNHTEKKITLTTGETKTVACVNSYPVDSGTLVVKKQVVTPSDYNAGDVAPADDRFQFVVSIRGFDAKITSLESFVKSDFHDANGTALATQPTVTVTQSGQSGQSGTLTFTLGAGESVALTLPNCMFTVSETALVRTADSTAQLADHYTTAYTVNGTAGAANQEHTLSGTTQPITAEFTNTYKRHYADLTIVTNAEGYSNQNFIFDVASVTDSTFALQVILGNNDRRTIKDLPVGQYTVTEQDAWSWRENTLTAQSVTPEDAGEMTYQAPVTLENGSVTVTFNYGTVDRQQWLSGYSYNIGKEG